MANLPVHPKASNFDDVAQAADPAGDHYVNDGVAALWVRNDHPTEVLSVQIQEQTRCTHPHHYTGGTNISADFAVQPGQMIDLGAFLPRWASDGSRQTHIDYSGSLDLSGNPVVWVAVFEGY